MEPTIVGEDEQSLGIEIEPADGLDPSLFTMEEVSNGGSPEGIIEGGNASPGLIQKEVCLGLEFADRLPVNPNVILLGIGLATKARNDRSVDLYPSLDDEPFRMTTGGEACLG